MSGRSLLLLLWLAVGAAGCSDAKASVPDPADDVDCSVLAFYFSRHAERSGVPPQQRHATRVVHEWYAAKIRKIAVERWGGEDGMGREVGPILEAVKRDPMAMTDSLLQCTERAVTDPGFNGFVAKLGR